MTKDLHRSPALILLGTLEIGGSERKFVELANRLVAADYPMHLAYLRPPDPLSRYIDARVPVVHLRRRGKYSLRALRRLSEYVRRYAIRSIVTVNQYPLTYAVPLGWGKGARGPRVVASINTSEILDSRVRAFMTLYAPLFRQVERVVFGSERQKTDWIAQYRLSAENCTVIYNGVDHERFDARQIPESRAEVRLRLGIPPDAAVIACVSQLRPEKGHSDLLQALLRIDDMSPADNHLLLVGDGVENAAIRKMAEELGLARRVHMAGQVDDVRPYLKASDVFALASVAVETFSNAALEAAAMGLPVVTSDVGGSREMFPKGRGGIVFPAGDVAALAKSVAQILSDPKFANAEGQRARTHVVQNYSIHSMVQSWVDVIWPECNVARS